VQELRRLSLHDANITPIQNNKALAASSFTFTTVQLYSIVKPMQNGINRNKYIFCVLKSLEPPKNLKTSRVP
jgi:hypothetical protein